VPRTITLYPFRAYDVLRRRWYRARYVAEIDEIGRRVPAFQITGRPEIRDVPDDWRELTAGGNPER
jgi:hypothetical protein